MLNAPKPLAVQFLAKALLFVGATLALAGCGNSTGGAQGQSDFQSAPPSMGGGREFGGVNGTGGSSPVSAAPDGTTRTVEETDLYRLEGDRLYYLNGYRGLMVFDVADVDHPKLLGRSPIFGWPVEMRVKDAVATVVVADWYGKMIDGTPFHGSIVRGIDANDPANMKILGEAKLGGWVRDTRIVGDVLYAVSEEYNWSYGWEATAASGGGVAVGTGVAVGPACSGNKVVISSVSFADKTITAKGRFDAPGWGGVFNVTADAILFAHDVVPPGNDPNNCYYPGAASTALEYLDITDPGGSIKPRGHLEFSGRVQGWGADNGRWNLDFADGKVAHAIGCSGQYCGAAGSNYVLVTADFSNPDAPAVASRLEIAALGWTPTARFDRSRMYLSPSDTGYYGGVVAGKDGGTIPGTPVQIYDLSIPAAPKLAGATEISGSVWLFIPSGDRLFALGNEAYDPMTGTYGSQISLRYIDVTDAANPKVLGTSTFGEGWAWTPAAGTFKAFTKDDQKGLVVLPFSGWSSKSAQYSNGLQLIEFTASTLRTAGAAKTKGWVERGIFVKNRLVSLSDLALSVVDYTDRDQPKLVTELTLARNVVDAKPQGATMAQLSTDWWGNDLEHSELRVVPTSQAEEIHGDAATASIDIEGANARVFHHGDLEYIVSSIRTPVDCPKPETDAQSKPQPADTGDVSPVCYAWHQRVQVVDLAGGAATPRGRVDLPLPYGYYWYGGWGWRGCYIYDWYWGDDVIQVGGDALAFRRWIPQYASNGTYLDSAQSLFVVDLRNPDAPTVASTRILEDPLGWWGDMRAIGDILYTSHYEWISSPVYEDGRTNPGVVRYYLDQINLTDRAHPVVGAKVNVPGFLVGASSADPSIIYTIDYRWYGDHEANQFDVLKLDAGKAYLQGSLEIPGWVGSTFVRDGRAYMSVSQYLDNNYSQSIVQLYQIDLSNPKRPTAQPSAAQKGWGWLLGVEGDRALVTSGWGGDGLDIYKLTSGSPPVFDQFVRTRGWGISSLSRQDDQIFLASGYWGVQSVDLSH